MTDMIDAVVSTAGGPGGGPGAGKLRFGLLGPTGDPNALHPNGKPAAEARTDCGLYCGGPEQ